MEPDAALRLLVPLLGTFAHLHKSGDYESERCTERYKFAHPDLMDVPPATDQ